MSRLNDVMFKRCHWICGENLNLWMDGWMTKELNLRSAKTVYLIHHRVKEAGEGCESLCLRL